MSDYYDALFIGVIIGTVSFMFPWLYKKHRFNRDSAKIITCIRDSKYTFRSTQAIVETTKFSQKKVEDICLRNEHIIQNKKNPHTWRIL